MPIAPPVNPPAPLSYTVLDLITDAFIEIGAVPPGEQPGPDEAQWGFRKLNYLIDVWQAKQFYVYSYAFNVYSLTPMANPVLIGPSVAAIFSTNGQPRPVRIESAALLLQNAVSPDPGLVDLIINIRDRQWWAAQQTKQIQTNVPTDLYYNPASPDGELNFWPVCNVFRQLRLEIWQMISQFVSIQDPIGGPGGPGTLPPAYRAALMLTLAEMLLPGSNREGNPELTRSALEARAAVFGLNAASPRICTQDAGMPRAKPSGQKQDFNWAYGNYPGGRPQ